MTNISKRYHHFWEKKFKLIDGKYLFPAEWLGRIILGKYTGVNIKNRGSVLDYSCGYGRNFQLLKQNFKIVYGSEISKSIVRNLYKLKHVKKLKIKLFATYDGIKKFIKKFDCIVCCNSIYYSSSLKNHSNSIISFKKNLNKDGIMIFNIPTKNHYLIKSGLLKSKNTVLIKKDPLKVRDNTQKMVFFGSSAEAKKFYQKFFSEVKISKSLLVLNNIREEFFVLVCK